MDNRHLIRILFLMAALFAVAGLRAQTRPDSRSFEHLWTLYDGIPQRHLNSRQAMLDTIGWKAEAEHDELQRFHVNFERISLIYRPNGLDAILLADSFAKTSPQPYCGVYHYLISKMLSTLQGASAVNAGSTDLSTALSWSPQELADNITLYEDSAFLQLFRHGLVPAVDFRFMTAPGNITALPGLTLLDVVLTSYIQHTKSFMMDRDFAGSLIDSVINIHLQRGDTQLAIEYALMRLNEGAGGLSPEGNPLWEGLAELERQYGANHAIEYEKGICLYTSAFENDTLPAEERKQRLLQCAQAFRNVFATAPDTFYRTNAEIILENLTQKRLSLRGSIPLFQQPSAKHLIPVKYRNVDTLYVSVYRVRDGEDFRLLSRFPKLQSEEDFAGLVQQQRYVLPQPVPYIRHTTDLWIDSLPVGNYLLLYHIRPECDSLSTLMAHELTITRIKILENTIGRKSYISFVDSRTGAPIAGLKVGKENWNSRNWEHRSYCHTDRRGRIRIHAPSEKYDWHLTVKDGKSCVLRPMGGDPEEYQEDFQRKRRRYYYNYHNYRFSEDMRELPSHLVLDRPMYRAGQDVHFKVYLVHGHRMAPHRRVFVELKDRNYQTIDSLELETNAFGTASGHFTLPATFTGRGTVHLWDNNYDRAATAGFEVAAYKLPTFKVMFEDSARSYTVEDTLRLSGRAVTFAGDPVPAAQVVVTATIGYNISKTLFLETDVNGRFTFSCAIDSNTRKKVTSSHSVTVEAAVTDLNGETQTGEKSYRLGKAPLSITLDLAKAYSEVGDFKPVDLAHQDTLRSRITVKNFNGMELPEIPVKVEMHKLAAPDTCKSLIYRYYKRPTSPLYSQSEYSRYFPQYSFDDHHGWPGSWPKAERVYSEERVFTEEAPLTVGIAGFEPGFYAITLSATDAAGRISTQEKLLEIRNTAQEKASKGYALRVNVLEHHKHRVSFLVSSDLERAQVTCHIYQGLRMRQKHLVMNHSQKVFSVPVRKKPGAVYVHGQTVQHNKVYRASDRIHFWHRKHFKPGVLQLNMTHWRSLVNPGSQERWSVEVVNAATHKPVDAEVLAWMVDTSLLDLSSKTNRYSYGIRNTPSWILPYEGSYRASLFDGLGVWPVDHDLSDRDIWVEAYHEVSKRSEMLKQFPRLDMEHISPSEFHTFSSYSLFGSSAGRMSGENIRTTPGRSVSIDEITPSEMVDTELKAGPSAGSADPEDARGRHPFRIRDHFTETAFFLPHLRTGSNGRSDFEFIVPDQFTTWQFYAMAHTKGLKTGKLQGSIVTKLPLMLQSNAPRFFREGDTLTLRAKITNRSESDLAGMVTVEFFNGEDGRPVEMVVEPHCRDAKFCVSTNGEREFQVPASGSQSVQFRIRVPEGVPAIGYRMVARAGNYGDGEENLLPVLPNRMLVTESCPFVVPAGSDTAVTFRRYRTHSTPTMQPLSYTVEATTNPAWLAIRALPYLMRYPYDCNEQTFSKLFAAATVQHALAQSPGLREVFEQWLSDTVNSALASPLLKNESLQSLLLEETPWLRDAQNESRQRQETAKLFTDENLQQQLDKSLNKLLHNQLTSGGWGWYGNRFYSMYITDHLVAGFFKLQRMGAEIPQADKMLEKAVRAADRYQETKFQMHLDRQELEPGAPFFFTEEDVHYLYARSFAPYDSVWLSKPYVRNLMELMMQNLQKEKLTRQAEVALVLHRTGDKYAKLQAQQIMEGIRQQAVVDREKGMYWRKEYSGYYYRWYEAPIERQALLIEAFTEISPSESELTMMKQWLLMQKEGNSWSNTKATAEAVYALLLGAPADLLQPAATVVTVGGETITATEAARAEAGTGYLQRVWAPEEMSPRLADIEVHTDGTHPTFGAAYWQYLEVPDKVEATGSGLSVRRTLYHQPAVGDGKTVAPVTDENPVRLGERITVKIVVTSDRDLEYVQVKDPRATAFEPVNFHEREGNQGGVWWVESPRDASNCFFFSRFPQGTIVLEYDVFAVQSGDFSAGATTVECMYAPEWRAQGAGARVTVR